jgi:aconitate hydratase
VQAGGENGKSIAFSALVRIDTPEELVAFKHGGILPYVLRQLVKK